MDQREPGERAGASNEAPGRITPMMEQYIEIRAANPDCLLFYRMGDFYELFFDDAEIASRALGITLTKRGKHLGDDIPMCGVPIHAADDYLQKLIGLGHRVAVCEQTEDPAEARRRGGKSVVRRAVTRLVTPGTITEDRLLDAGRNNYLAALTKTAASDGGDRHALAWVDISTGEFRIGAAGPGGLATLIGQVEPREVLVPERLAEEAEIRSALHNIGAALTPLPAAFFDAGSAEERLCGVFGVMTMEAFGAFSRGELSAGAALIAYVEKTQIAKRPPIEPPRRILSSEIMRLDAATKANLEIFWARSGGRAGSLIAAVDRTRTAAGARLLVERLTNPSCNPGLIEERLDAVEFFLEKGAFRCALGAMLGACPDVLRAMARVGLDRGGPRDLAALRSGLQAALDIIKSLSEQEVQPGLVARQQEALAAVPADLVETLDRALADDLPLLKRDGGFIKRGFDEHLDEARALRDESRKVIASLQARYAEATGIRSLKIRHNNVLGYFVEVTAGQAASLSGTGAAEKFIHRQTLASAMRFTTTELGDLEQKIASAAERALAIELEIFADLAAGVAGEEPRIRAAARALAELDVASALAELAASENYVRPKIEAGLAFEIVGGRHPVVEQALRAEGASFVGNDCGLGPEEETLPSLPYSTPLPPLARAQGAPSPARGEGEEGDQLPLSGTPPLPAAAQPPSPVHGEGYPSPSRSGGPATLSPQGGEGFLPAGKIWLITGPNMAGKSTFLRQNALIAILAQAGSFVPAKAARIGIVDAVFSRVGAADDLARGRSTFMVEMVETAAILNQAGPRALVILDEIGRGTATFDGLSIAWAVIEHLHEENCCRTLFATHYHELTALSAKLERVTNATMKVKEWKGDVVFLHEIVPGAADRSYGIQVAKLAGLPAGVIKRAKNVLESLEKSDRSRPKAMIDDLPLFAVKAVEPAEQRTSPALAALDEIVPDELSPKQALERLYELKRLRREEGG